MITGKLNLAALKHVVFEQKGQTGMVKGIFIPIEQNNLFLGKEGAVYLDLVCFPLKNATEFSDHLVKQSLPKDVREKMTKEEQDTTPIIGNIDTRSKSAKEDATNNVEQGTVFTPENKLPF